jgi:hypothetical protein
MGKMGLAAGAAVGGVGVGLSYPTASVGLFFRIGMALGALGILGRRRRAPTNFFHFGLGVGAENRGLGCSIFDHFGPVLGLFGVWRLLYICPHNFLNLHIFKALCLFRRRRSILPVPGSFKAFSNIFHSEPNWPKKIRASSKRRNIVCSFMQTGRKKSALATK